MMGELLLSADLKAAYFARKEELDAALHQALDSGWYILGKGVAAFEREFASYVGAGYGIGAGSGTEALHLGLRALDIGPGDEVITVSHTAVATVAAIELAGATPVLVDIDPATYTLDVSSLHAALSPKTRAIIPVHLYGHPADLSSILRFAREHGLRVLEDCAQSHGARVHGKMTGSWGDLAAFSFYPTKNLGALGDAGLLVAATPELAERARLLREYGWRERYISELPGFNTRLDELQAAVLRVRLKYLDQDNERRRSIAARYAEALAGAGLGLPETVGDVTHCHHQYVVRSPRRDAFQARLRELGIGTLIHYPVPVHLQPAYRDRVRTVGTMSETERAAAEVLSLPIYPELTDEQLERAIGAVRQAAAG